MKRFISYLETLQKQRKLTRTHIYIALFGVLLFLTLAISLPNYLLRQQEQGNAQVTGIPPTPALLPPPPGSLPTPTDTPFPISTPTNTPTPTISVPSPTTPPIDTTLPTVSITYPLNGAAVAKGTTITISATATDNIAVQRVEFYVGSTLKCPPDYSYPYTCNWRVPKMINKQYTITAKAYDTSGNTATNIVTVTAR